MFRKRNFSLRDSPDAKATSSSPRPLIHTESPAKRLKFGDGNQFLSSTFLSETKLSETNDSRTDHGRTESLELERATIVAQEKPYAELDTKAKIPVETPPPTPELKLVSKLDVLEKRLKSLTEENQRLDSRVEGLTRDIRDCQRQINVIRVARFKYDDFVTMITRGQNEIRDHLNKIFGPGNDLAQKFEPVMQEFWTKHSQKLEKKTMEWNCRLEQAECVMVRRFEELNHEMELHRRTLLHQEHLNDVNDAVDTSTIDNIEKETKADNIVENAADNTTESADICVDVQDSEDCIIINQTNCSNPENEEIVTEQSVEEIKVKQESEDEDTDIDIQSEEARSFTPCQAQRPE